MSNTRHIWPFRHIHHLCISSIYDVLEERFIENGDYTELPGNEQTLRNYVHYLQDNGIVDKEPKNSRIYEYVFDTPRWSRC